MTSANPPAVVIPESVRRIAQLVQVQAVRLVKASCETVQARPDDKISDLNFTIRVGSEKGPHPRALYAFVGIEVTPMSKDEPKRTLAKLSCDFAVHYVVPDDTVLEAISDEDAEAFAGFNGVYNAWPYARELLQNFSSRMLLPAVIIPLYRPGMFGPPTEWKRDPVAAREESDE